MHANGDSAGPARSGVRSGAWTEPPLRVLGVVLVTAIMLIAMALAANTEAIEVSTRNDSTSASFEAVPGEQPAPDETTDETRSDAVERSEPVRIPRPLLIGFAIVAAMASLYFLSLQRIALKLRRSKAPAVATAPQLTAEEEATQIVQITRDLIDELREGDDPRSAIQRAYAAVETGLGTDELARKPAETPLTYLNRVFGRNKEAAPPLENLTRLFEVARFSQSPIDEAMRAEAIAHLVEIRERYKDQLASKAITFNTRAL